MPRIVLLLAWFVSQGSERGQGAEQCGGVLTSARGLIQTPRFPGRLPTPLHCRWVLDATTHLSDVQDASIVVYFTQLFVSTGLTFTEFDYYEPDSTFQLGGRVIHRVTEQNVTTVQWLLTRRPYLVVDLALDRLEGSHLRALDGLLDVYGLNMTYETRRDAGVRNDTCSVVGCSLSGHCYADADYSEYWCECFPGFLGPDCGQGPLCRPDHCYNGGSCRQAGAAAVLCICPEGFTGSKCEAPLQDNGCGGEEEGCTRQCPEDGTGEPCVCGATTAPAARDRARYEGTVRLTNVSAVRSCLESPSCSLKPMLTKQISKYLRATNLSVMEDLRVIDIGFSGEVRFHFWGGKREGGRVRESLNRLVQRGRLGNVSLVPTHLAITQEPTLHLQSVRVNQARPVVRQGDEFILSCFAQGSSHMMFRWFKDGVFVNITKARRSMWTRLLPLDSAEQYTALLGVEGADPLDRGRYTCQVTDWGYQQCSSIALDVLQAPLVKLDPVTLTVDKGENVTVKCTSPNELQYDTRFGYSWTRNNALFKMTPGLEYWEDLYPGGSILSVANVQRSVTYSCHVHGGSRPAARSVRLELLAASAPTCPAEGGWPRTGPGVAAAVDCPPPYAGLATRLCLLVDRALAAWQTPDYSDCVSDRIAALADNFQRVTLGHGNWTARDVLGGVASALRERGAPLPGEGEPLVALLGRVEAYLAETGAAAELADATDRFYVAVSELLRHRNAIINHQRVDELHQVAGQWALVWGGQPGSATVHLALDSLVVDIFRYEPAAIRRNLAIVLPRPTLSYPNWYTNRVALHIEANKKSQNASSAVAVITYSNLSQFLPQRYSQVLENGSEVQYEAGSSALVTVLGRGPLRVTSEVELQLSSVRPGWQVGCGLALSPSLRWNLSACQATPAQDGNATLCRCPQLGTYAALLVKAINLDQATGRGGSAPRAVLVGCLCCLVQSTLALALLSLRLYRHTTCITFLKLQCCCATASAMAAFLYATSRNLPQDMYPSVSVAVQASVLVSMSTHLSKVLLVYTEVVHLPTVKHIRPTVICIITGVPLLVVLLNHIAQSTTDSPLSSWWLAWDSLMFYTCLACGSLLVAAFLFLYYQVTRRLCGLKLLKSSDTKKAVLRRQGLLNRAAVVLTATVIMCAASTLYVNNPTPRCQYFFSCSCALLGFVVLVCYVLHCESPLHLQLLTAFKMDNSFSSESDSSPLNIFTKQEADRECEGAPPRVAETALVAVAAVVRNGKAEPVREAPPILKVHAEDCRPPPSRPKAVTFHNDLVTGCDRGAVDMEVYPGSPRRLQAPDGGDVITGTLVDAPSAVMCSVDVEPCAGDLPRPPSLAVPSPSSSGPAFLPTATEDRDEPVTPDGDEGDVMDRICHDLDYLLGRLPAEAKPDIPRLDKQETEEQTSL